MMPGAKNHPPPPPTRESDQFITNRGVERIKKIFLFIGTALKAPPEVPRPDLENVIFYVFLRWAICLKGPSSSSAMGKKETLRLKKREREGGKENVEICL